MLIVLRLAVLRPGVGRIQRVTYFLVQLQNGSELRALAIAEMEMILVLCRYQASLK